jgi:hypothetical protein
MEQLSIDWCLAAVRICGRLVLCTGAEEMACGYSLNLITFRACRFVVPFP